MSDINIVLSSPKYACLYKKEYRHIVLVSGRGTGKSWAVAESIIYHTHEFNCRVFCARTVQNSLTQSSWKTIKDCAIRLGVYDDYDWIESKSTIRCKLTTSEIYFGGIDNDPQKFKSTEGIDIFWYEESQTASQEALDIIFPTIRKQGSVLIWTANPRFEQDPFSRTFLINDVKREDTVVVKLIPEDNKFFPDVIKAEMEYCKRTDFEAYRHIWLGEFASSSSESLIQMDAIRACIKRPIEDQPYQVFAGLDIGATGDPTACYIRQGRKFIALKEWNEADHNKLIDYVIDFLNQYSAAMVMPDATGFGYTFAQNLSARYGQDRVVPINFGQSASMGGFANKRAQMAMTVRDAIVMGVSLPDEPTLIEELSTIRAYKTASDRWQIEPKSEIRSRLGRSTNWLDAIMLSYAIPDRTMLNANATMQAFNRISINASAWSN